MGIQQQFVIPNGIKVKLFGKPQKQGVKTASYFWPGSELNLEYRRPDYYEKYEHKRDYNIRIEGVLEWLKLTYSRTSKIYYTLF